MLRLFGLGGGGGWITPLGYNCKTRSPVPAGVKYGYIRVPFWHAHGREVYQFAGAVYPDLFEETRARFASQGLGAGTVCPPIARGEKPHKVIWFMEYKGSRVNEDGTPYGG